MTNYSNEVTFKTTKNAPANFDFWTFFWTFPQIDKNASLEYFVTKPDGKEYYHWKLKDHTNKTPKSGEQCRSDFGVDFVGGNPRIFYNNKVKITFAVDKGKIKFDQKNVRNFRFHFSKTIKADKI